MRLTDMEVLTSRYDGNVDSISAAALGEKQPGLIAKTRRRQMRWISIQARRCPIAWRRGVGKILGQARSSRLF